MTAPGRETLFGRLLHRVISVEDSLFFAEEIGRAVVLFAKRRSLSRGEIPRRLAPGLLSDVHGRESPTHRDQRVALAGPRLSLWQGAGR